MQVRLLRGLLDERVEAIQQDVTVPKLLTLDRIEYCGHGTDNVPGMIL